MANPTTNFGWVMPTNTDLVTDLPADFAVFGQGVDTTMADLKGGTTGQILSKATNTDMDFTWITNDVGDITAVNTTAPLAGGATSGAVTLSVTGATTAATGVVQLSDSTSTTSSVLAATPTAVKSAYDLANAAIAKSTVTTAGDIIYRNATVPTRLGIGTAGQVLQVNAGATAPEWVTATGASPANFTLLNSGSTALSGSATYTLSGLAGAYTQFAIYVVAASGNSANGYFFVRLNGSSGSNYVNVGQKITVASVYTDTGVFTRYSDTAATQWYLAKMSSNVASSMSGGMQIFGGKTTGAKVIMGQGAATTSTGTDPEYYNIHGYNTSLAATITSISFGIDTGSFDAGNIYIYGTA